MKKSNKLRIIISSDDNQCIKLQNFIKILKIHICISLCTPIDNAKIKLYELINIVQELILKYAKSDVLQNNNDIIMRLYNACIMMYYNP
jgi:hypothetical protein